MTSPPKRKPKLALLKSDKAAQNQQAESGIPINPINYYLKFQLQGIKKPFVYVVAKGDWDRVSALFDDREIELPFFVGFDDVDGRTAIHVRPDSVRLFQALFDAGKIERKRARKDDLNRVSFHVEGITEPLDYDMEQEDIGDLNVLLEHFVDGLKGFVTFVDNAGEQNSIRAESIMLIESPNYYPPLDEAQPS